jgi:hypothetical protein
VLFAEDTVRDVLNVSRYAQLGLLGLALFVLLAARCSSSTASAWRSSPAARRSRS